MLLLIASRSAGEADQIASTYFGLEFRVERTGRPWLENGGFGGGPDNFSSNFPPSAEEKAGLRCSSFEVA